MGQILEWANENLSKIKPKIENKTGVRLENITIKCLSLSDEKKTDLDCHRTLMAINPLEEDTIYADEKAFYLSGYDDEIKDILLPVTLAHELSHLIHIKLMENKVQKAEADVEKVERLKEAVRGKISYERYVGLIEILQKKNELLIKALDDADELLINRSFAEGFAMYMSLDYLTDIYDNCSEEILDYERTTYLSAVEYSDTEKPYVEGYKFIKAVINVLGQERIYEIAKTPPTQEEILEPQKYLSRNFPKNKAIITRDSH